MRTINSTKLFEPINRFLDALLPPNFIKGLIVFLGLFVVNLQYSYAATFTVTNNNDAGVGSLRQAILDANLDALLDVIEFDIGTGLQTIQLLTPLPTIDNDLIIDGNTQPGFVDIPIIEIDGSQLVAESIIRMLGVAVGEVKGLIINGSPFSAIAYANCTGGMVDNCFLGTDPTGTVIDGNTFDGVAISNSNDILIQNSLISGNSGDGIFITNSSTAITVRNCKIGTDISGTLDLGNVLRGIFIQDSNNNTIGGDAPADRNIISGNEEHGVAITGNTNTVKGNFIGTDVSGNLGLGNGGEGVIIQANNNIIGTTVAGNVISGNVGSGVHIDNTSTGNIVIGNFIGTDVTGFIPLPNEFGVSLIANSTDNFIGGAGGLEGNLISSNMFSGILVAGNSNGSKIFANQIGTNLDCTGLLPNGEVGVLIDNSDNCMIGNGTEDGQNLISGNMLSGIQLQNGSDGNEVLQNCIGVDIAGTGDLGNSGSGITIIDSEANIIGSPSGRNIISGNDTHGISVSGAGAQDNIFQNNIIGLDINGLGALPNNEFGIVFFGTAGANQIGGLNLDEGNIVSANIFSGILSQADNQTIEGNKIGVDINGNNDLGNDDNGIFLTGANNCSLINNVISGNTLSGISLINGATGNQIKGNKIGTNETGDAEIENGQDGIRITDSNTNTIGGSGAGDSNLISGNDSDGIDLDNSDGNRVLGNKIGTDILGLVPIPNGDAIFIGSNSTNTEVGGANPGEGNLISGNNFDGVDINSNSTNTSIKGNIIGLNVDGTAILENGDNGVEIDDSPNTIIGGTTANERNLISGNDGIGIRISNAGLDGAIIFGNFIGTDIDGLLNMGNGEEGIEIDAPDVVIGGGNIGEGNIISGNGGDGILHFGDNAIIQGNKCGTDVNGTIAIPNEDSGIDVNGDNALVGGSNPGEGNLTSGNEGEGIESFGDDAVIKGNIVGMDINGLNPIPNELSGMSVDGINVQIGGQGVNEGNLISANLESGINLFDGDDAIIEGNIIGLDINGTAAFGNLEDGINDGSQGFVTIGGLVPAARNLISANGLNGISSFFGIDGEIVGNFIGTDISGTLDFGNGAEGISFFASLNYAVGGDVPGSPNVIAFNAMDGIGLSDDQFFFSGLECEAIQIAENSIFSNANKGINYLGNQTLVATPVLTSVTSGATPNVQGTLNGNPNTDYTIEFFKNFNANASGNHEGEIFIGTEVVTTDGVGVAIINSVLNQVVNANEIVTATAREANANTSEFSNGVTAGALPIELISIAAKPFDGYILLQWITESELDNRGFYIERLNDENAWKTIAFVDGMGTKTTPTTYAYRDNDVLADRTYFYRLKQEDIDGRIEYTPIVSAVIKGHFSVGEFYPNPADAITNVDVNLNEAENVEIEVYDIIGRCVSRVVYTIEGRNVINLPISDLSAGKYYVRIIAENKLFVRNLIKKD